MNSSISVVPPLLAATMTYGRYNKYTFVEHIEQTERVKILRSMHASGESLQSKSELLHRRSRERLAAAGHAFPAATSRASQSRRL
jgi:hypothetical protein